MKTLFQKLKTPLIILIVFLVLLGLWEILNLPSEEVLIEIAKEYFIQYGLITVLIASLIEGMLLIGMYLPGGLVIFLGVILSAGDPKRAVLSVLMTIIGLGSAYILNYFLGKYGWHKLFTKFGLRKSLQDAETQFQKYGYKSIIFSYWQPNLAALVSTSAGVLNAHFKKFLFYSTSLTICWSIFWGSIAYILGQQVLSYLGGFFLFIMIVWIATIFIGEYKLKK